MPRLLRIGENHLGRAVYAAKAFVSGDRIGVVRGQVLDDPDYSSTYSIDLGGPYSLEPSPPFRFLNHCCSPNCRLLLVEPPRPSRRGLLQCVVEARKRIQPGDELTIDYSWPADSAIPCGCGSRWCRGWIVSRKDLPRLKRLAKRKSAGR